MAWFLVLGVPAAISASPAGTLRRMGSCFVSRTIGACTEIPVTDAA